MTQNTNARIRNAAARVAKAEQSSARIAALVAATVVARIDTNSQIDVLTRTHEDVCAAYALGDASASDVNASRTALDAARAVESGGVVLSTQESAALAGLARRQEDAAAELEAARAELTAAESEWLQVELLAADSAYLAAAQKAWAAWVRIAALKTEMHSRAEAVPIGGTEEPRLPGAGPHSCTEAARLYRTPHGVGLPCTPRYDASAARMSIQAELHAVTARQNEGGIKAMVQRLVAG